MAPRASRPRYPRIRNSRIPTSSHQQSWSGPIGAFWGNHARRKTSHIFRMAEPAEHDEPVPAALSAF
jgi:hypothetical protein